MRKVFMVVGNTVTGKAITWAYPFGESFGHYKIPTYELSVSGTDSSGKKSQRVFEVIRFGIQCKMGSTPKVVGLADAQIHLIKTWIPTYSVHSANSTEMGAWQVYDNFLIHDGPDNPQMQAYASIGCIEICNGPSGFDVFNNYLIELSGPKSSTRDSQLVEIGRAKNMTISYLKATRPPLEKW